MPDLRDPRDGPDGPDRQSVEHPALTDDLDPAPDHGEDTDVGSQQLPDRRALITGGDSGIGRTVAVAFAREGADVHRQAAVEHMPVGGSILFSTSIQATSPSPELLDSAASTAALVNLTQSLSRSLINRGVRVNGVAPHAVIHGSPQ